MARVRIHSMHGPTVFMYKSIDEGIKKMLDLKMSNGGLYRLVDEDSDKEYMRLDTYALYWPLCHEANHQVVV